MPMLRAVPLTDLIAASIEAAFRSGSFCLAMSATCFSVTLPTLSLFGDPEPLATPAARFSRIEAGGGFVMKVDDWSLNTEITTGIMRPSSSFELVFALNCLQNSMMLMPAWPSAGPTGGAGVALPAAIWSFTDPVNFFGAIFQFLLLIFDLVWHSRPRPCVMQLPFQPDQTRVRPGSRVRRS